MGGLRKYWKQLGCGYADICVQPLEQPLSKSCVVCSRIEKCVFGGQSWRGSGGAKGSRKIWNPESLEGFVGHFFVSWTLSKVRSCEPRSSTCTSLTGHSAAVLRITCEASQQGDQREVYWVNPALK